MVQNNIQQVYDRVSAEYAKQFRTELENKPFDRKMLDWLIERVAGLGTICDMGCGPGQIAAYLKSQGAMVCGIDLSPGMVAQATQLHSDIPFETGDMLNLSGVAENSLGGIAAFYAIVHFSVAFLPQVFDELFRVLRPGGTLLLTFHIGQEVKHLDEWWGKEVSLDFFFFETSLIVELLTTAGFSMEEVIERAPYPDVEFPSHRAYLFARKQ